MFPLDGCMAVKAQGKLPCNVSRSGRTPAVLVVVVAYCVDGRRQPRLWIADRSRCCSGAIK
eukprot:scaffold228767_cov31-Tisochrysis_lutea.AAC.1